MSTHQKVGDPEYTLIHKIEDEYIYVQSQERALKESKERLAALLLEFRNKGRHKLKLGTIEYEVRERNGTLFLSKTIQKKGAP